MAVDAGTFLKNANPRKVARWLYERARHAIRAGSDHASRLHMQAYDALHRRPRLPPGSLAARCLHDAVTDDRYYMTQFRRYGPIFKLFWGSGHVKICVEGFERGRRLLNQHRGALRLENIQSIKLLVPAEYLRSMSPEIHPHYRRVFLGAFRGDLVIPSEAGLRGLMQRGLAAAAQPAGVELPPTRRLYETLNTIAIRSLLCTMLGVDPESETAASLEAMYRRLGPRGHVERAGAKHAAVFHAIHDVVAGLRQSIGRDAPGPVGDSVLRRLVETAPSAIDETVIGNLIYMVERGRHDLRDLLHWIVKYLSDHPAPVAALHADLAGPVGASRLAEACVLETLRLDQSEHLNRRVLQSFEFEGFHFPKNSWVSILTRESHRNPEAFADPDAYRPERFLGRRPSAEEYAPFGIDEHQCIASTLSVRLCTLLVEELVRGYTWTVTADGPRFLGLHWEPSRHFTIELVPAAPVHGKL
jgi:cytochrome P450